MDAVDSITCRQCGSQIDTAGQTAFMPIACPACNAANTVPARLGHFKLLQLLGTGGMGGVYCARDETLGRDVAIKVMLKSLGDDPKFIETFKHEAQAVARLNHPHIAQIYSFGQEKGQPYIVMELVNGERLDAMIEVGEPLNVGVVMRIGLEIAQGLSAADEAGLVHGDIKPENILLDAKGQAKLVDFGLASAKHQTDDGELWGSPYYIAPERVRRQAIDARADIYMLGATLYHALTLHPPFEGDTPAEVAKARLTQAPLPLKTYCPSLDEEVESIVLRMLEADLSRRYPTYNSLISDLKRVVGRLGGGPNRVVRKGRSIRLARKGAAGASGAVPGTATGMEPVTDAGAGKSRIVIRKGGGGPGIVATGVQKSITAALLPDPVAVAAAAEQKRLARRRRTGRTLVFLGVVLVLGAVGGIVATIAMRREQRIEQRREWFAYQGSIEAASNLYGRISGMVADAQAVAENGTARLSVLGEQVEAVTGKPFIQPERVVPAVATPAEPAEAAAVEPGDEVHVGDPGDEGEAEADAGVDDAGADTGVEAAPLPEAAAVEVAPVVASARLAVAVVYAMQDLAAEALDQGGRADAVHEQALAARTSRDMQPLTNELGRIERAVAGLQDELRDRQQTFMEHVREVARLRDAFEKDVAQQRRLERERAEQLRLEEERRREAERKQQRLELEMAEVGVVTNAIRVQLQQNAFREAREEIEAKLATLETDEARTALGVMRDRYRMLEGLQAFLITRINEHPLGWGWGQEGSARDILGADRTGIRVRGRAEPAAWSIVTPRQMLALIDHYLAHSGTLASQRSIQTMAAAIYCYELGGERGKELARQYFDNALTLRYPQQDAMRLLPLGW